MKKIHHLTRGNFFLFGLLCLVWFIFRTGSRPSRAVYPCQQAAAANAWLWTSLYVLPFLPAIVKKIPRFLHKRSFIYFSFAFISLVLVIWVSSNGLFSSDTGPAYRSVNLDLRSQQAALTPASDIFVIKGTSGNDQGVAELINLMGLGGTLFYQSPNSAPDQGPSGLISANDVVIIKVNCQWDERGGTNTDVLKAVIQAVLLHPDGFTGEIIVADNGQAQNGPTGTGGSFEYENNNAEDTTQSIQKVVDSFAGSGRVSTYLWDTITKNRVSEYIVGNDEDGYIVGSEADSMTGLLVSYPKFKTAYGTRVSFKSGIWDPVEKTYNSERLKVINLPVLKSHKQYGVSASVKHYMGVASDRLTRQLGAQAHFTIGDGGMGKQMVETRFPVLNIIDAIWINATPGTGPYTTYDMATRTNVIAASTDPFALDYYAARYILYSTAQELGNGNKDLIDPDNTEAGSFGDWLRKSMNEALLSGRQVTLDESQMNISVANQGEAPPAPTSVPSSSPLPSPSPSPVDTPAASPLPSPAVSPVAVISTPSSIAPGTVISSSDPGNSPISFLEPSPTGEQSRGPNWLMVLMIASVFTPIVLVIGIIIYRKRRL